MNNTMPWTILGPGGGGAQFLPTISPHDPRTVLVACDMTGSYVTHDAGAHWRMFNLRQPTRFFAFDPNAPQTYYAGAVGGLWRTEDAGKTWRLVDPDPATVIGVRIAGDHGETSLATNVEAKSSITAIAIDPADSRRLYATKEELGTAFLAVSTDRGATWTREADLAEAGLQIYVDPASPREARTLYVRGQHAVQRREGGRWEIGVRLGGEQRLVDASLGFSAGGGRPTAYAITRRALYVSDDGGASWHETHLPGEDARFTAVATSLRHSEVAYVSFQGLQREGKTLLGVARTGDGGKTWDLAWQEEHDKPAENLHDSWITPTFGPDWGENPLALGVSPTDPNLCYATDFGRTLRTADGGKSWQALYSRQLADGSYTSTGLDVTTCYGVHFDPFDARRLFLSYTDIGLFRSENGGEGWLPSSTGVPHSWGNTTYWVAFDPTVQGRMWAVMSGTHDLPRPKMWRNRGMETYHGGVCRSDDGGKTWTVANAGMPETAATHVLLDPRSPAGKRTLYVTGFGRGVYKSVDDGATWTLKNAGLEGAEPMAWRLTQDSAGTLYLVVARRTDDGSFDNAGDGALYRSIDGAEHWAKLPLPRGVNGPNALTIDSHDPKRLYLAAWARDDHGTARDGGVFLSTDGGGTWTHILHQDQHVYDVTLDPRDPAVLYTCGFSSSVWKSSDRGKTWRRLGGYNFKWGHRVIPDPHDPHKIYVTTFGGSLWHGPADGVPNAVEDIVTPALRYGA